jgi:hypothetical protein
LSWVKALIDDVLADEFDSEDLEFSWSTESSIDPQTQEAILSSYATKGILTINEARVALGREPLTEAAANTAMVLTGSGYVPLGQGAPKQEPPAQKRLGIAKYNHYHDERGRFTTADGVGSGKVNEANKPANGKPKPTVGHDNPETANFSPRQLPGNNPIQPAVVSCEELWDSDWAICHSAAFMNDPHYYGHCMAGLLRRNDECHSGLPISPLLPY